MSFISRVFAQIDAAMERRTAMDLRLLYGFGVPVVLTGLLISLGIAFVPSTLTVVALMAIEAVMLAAVALGFTRMLSDPADNADYGD